MSFSFLKKRLFGAFAFKLSMFAFSLLRQVRVSAIPWTIQKIYLNTLNIARCMFDEYL